VGVTDQEKSSSSPELPGQRTLPERFRVVDETPGGPEKPQSFACCCANIGAGHLAWVLKSVLLATHTGAINPTRVGVPMRAFRLCACALLSVFGFNQSVLAATLDSIQGRVQVNSGSGFHQVVRTTELAPGTSVMASPGGGCASYAARKPLMATCGRPR
jgi:hypothetical protein